MATATLEELQQRVANLEAAVAALLANQSTCEKDWRRALDVFAGDEGIIEGFAEAMRLREADREAARNDLDYFDKQPS